MQQGHLKIGGICTNVITYGKWVEESFSSNEKDLVLCIPGNPGVTNYYRPFLETIYNKLGYPVWIVGHAGHEPPKNKTIEDVPDLTDNEKLYGLHGQIMHKRIFIETYVPKNVRVHFIGHSIGSYIILELLKSHSIKSRAVANYLLFPTIEYMAETFNGKALTRLTPHLVWIVAIFSWIFSILPSLIQYVLILIYTMIASVSRTCIPTIIDMIDPETLRKIFYMAFDEMKWVKERANDVLVENKHMIKLYYATSDGWAPQSYCRKLKRDIPDIDAEICTRKFEHAFVLRHSEEVGDMVADWIKNA